MRLRKIASLILILSVALLIVSCTPKQSNTEFEVAFDSDGGSLVAAQTVAKGGLVVKPEAPTKEGYSFIGWYNNDVEWNFENDVVNEKLTLTAKWAEEHTHTPVVDKAVAPTCTETGLTEGSHCSECNEIIVAQEEISALGHDYSINEVAPGCLFGGYVEHTCTVCAHSYKENEVDPKGHTPGAAATCTMPQVCSVCSTLLNPALGHDVVVDNATEPDCENTGLTAGSHCGVCNETLEAQNMIPAL